MTGNPATSNTVNMTVNAMLPVSVSIVASANPVDPGASVTFTATAFNGGASPVYQWQVNSIDAGSNNAEFIYAPVNGDVVTCVLTSNADCITGNPATSNTVTMTVNSVPATLELQNQTVTGIQCFNAVQTIIVAGNGAFFSVPDGASATMIAGQNILYYPGTIVEPGGYLHGYISSPGGPFCVVPPKSTVVAGNKENTRMPERNFFRVYPNPTNGEFTLALDGYVPSEKINVVLYGMKGEIISSAEIINEMKHEFSLSGNPAGLYLIRVTSGSRSGSSRIVKVD